MSSHFAIKTLSRSIDHQPMHHLFSPTALDYDLTYVDKTYYPSSNNSQSNDTATAATTTTTTTTTTTLHNNINTLNKLPDKLSSLQNLALHKTLRLVSSISRLDLRNAGLCTLPSQISLLTRLTLLDVSHNKMDQLPSTIDQLTHLRHLNISHNEIAKLPASISALSKLMVLDVSSNPIKRVSANIARLSKLAILDLSSTEIKAIPTELLVLSHTTIKTENCLQLLKRSVKMECKLNHDPVSLLETCARHVLEPILFGKTKKNKRNEQEVLDQLPHHLRSYISKPKSCSSCGGPYIDSYVVRYRIVQRQDETWVPVEYRLCAAHWNNEDERLLSMFSQAYRSFPHKKNLSKLIQPDAFA